MGYTASDTGRPCWYELGTKDLDAAGTFYSTVLGWEVKDSGVPDMAYRLASRDGNGVAGLMDNSDQAGNPPANWIFYTEVASVDGTADMITELGGSILMPPADIPGTGRFAVAADPQGAVFGILQPAPMDEALQVSAFDQTRTGHGNWHELMTPDPEAAFTFYSTIFGWTKGETMDMGEDGDYQLYRADETDLGGMMRQGNSPVPAWLVYFGVESAQGAIDTATGAGGALVAGPHEVPGGAYIAIFTDPQGAAFGVVGPQ